MQSMIVLHQEVLLSQVCSFWVDVKLIMVYFDISIFSIFSYVWEFIGAIPEWTMVIIGFVVSKR